MTTTGPSASNVPVMQYQEHINLIPLSPCSRAARIMIAVWRLFTLFVAATVCGGVGLLLCSNLAKRWWTAGIDNLKQGISGEKKQIQFVQISGMPLPAVPQEGGEPKASDLIPLDSSHGVIAQPVEVQVVAPKTKKNLDLDFDHLMANLTDIHKHYEIPTPHNLPETINNLDAGLQQEMVQFAKETRPILHAEVRKLMGDFLTHKLAHGSEIEKALYAKMTPQGLINRLLKKRPIEFLFPYDQYVLRNGAQGKGGFEKIGTPEETAPLILKDYLSYDEMQISALLGVSVRTHFINDGARKNVGIAGKVDTFQKDGVYVGLVGARLEKRDVMEWQHIMITKEQNTAENGYGATAADVSPQRSALALWEKLYKVDGRFPSYEEAQANSKEYVELSLGKGNSPMYLNGQVYYERIKLTAMTYLAEANSRGQASGKAVYVRVVGLGLGAWQMDKSSQEHLMMAAYSDVLKECQFPHISDIDFTYFWKQYLVHVGSNSHIKVHFTKSNPAAKLTGDDAGKFLVAQYAWDGNSYPGNEYWTGLLSASGDPAAACCSYIVPLQMPEANPFVSAANCHLIRVKKSN